MQDPDYVLVHAGDQRIQEFDDGDLCPQRVIDRCHFQSDDTAADHQQAPRHFGKFQRAGGIEDALVFVRKARNARHAGSRRDDAVLERDRLRAFGGLHLQRMGRSKRGFTLDHLHFALLGQPGQAARELPDHARFPLAQLGKLDFRLAEADAGVCHLVGFGDHPGDMQERFRRNAADVEAHAAQRRVALDQDHFLAEVGGAKRRGIAARTGAEHHDFGVSVSALRERREAGGGRRGGDCYAAGIARRRRNGGCRCFRRRSGLGGGARRRGGARFGCVEHEDQRAFGNFIADLDLELLHHPGSR